MRHRCNRFLATISLLSGAAWAQTVTSSMVGTVTDPANAVVPGVQVQLKEQGTAAVRGTLTGNDGLFRFPNLSLGTYTVTIRANGFKTRTVTDINLSSSETRDLGTIALELGNVAEEIAVTAEATPIQTASSERSASVDGAQLNLVAIKGRDLFSYMKLIPGVVDTNSGRDAAGGSVMGGLTINGGAGIYNFTVDGVNDIDTGCSSCFTHFEPNIDSISEIKIMTSNYAAEFGRNAGATISVITKGGTQQFHGSGWWTHRHEQFNANDFFNNQTGLPRTPYRFNIAGWSLGGPVFIPGHFNSSKTKLFFFASQEYTRQLVNAATQYRTMPTELERAGDFSQSLDGSGKLITITDPSTGSPFPGNVIPKTQINGWGLSMLNFFPLPNTTFAPGTPQYRQDNFQQAASGIHPRRNDLVRLDVDLTSKLNGYARWGHDADYTEAVFTNIQFLRGVQNHPNPGHGYAAALNYTISPTLINQFTFGDTINNWTWFEDHPEEVDRSLFDGAKGTPQAGQPLPSLFPLHKVGPGVGGDLASAPANAFNGYAHYLPGVSFGSTPPNTPSFSIGNPEYVNANRIYEVTDNLSKVAGNHSLKAGIYVEFNRKIQPAGTGYLGSYSFSPDSNNPLNTGDGFANALLGNFTSYSENTARTVFNVTYWNVEFYVQDNWRITRRLTLDLGVRFYHQTPQIDHDNTFAYFDRSLYSKAKVPRFYVPAIVGGKRVAQDPATGATAPVTQIGFFVPGTGDPANGQVVAGLNNVPLETYSTTPLAAAPRLGFAWDVFGNGKTALRGGVGVFYDRLDGNQVYNMSGAPPLAYTPQVAYGTIGSLASSTGAFGPSNTSYWAGHTPLPQARNASFGVQQSLGHDTVLDVAYQGAFGLHRFWRVNLNAIPLGANFDLARFGDPTQPGRPLPAVFERVNYPGLGDMNEMQFGRKSNYHSLQVSLRRQLARGLLWGAAYTWSRNMDLASFDPLVPDNYSRNYGPSGADRRQTLTINYAYDIPQAGKALHSKLLGIVTDGWNLSGITAFSTGAPFTPGFNTSPSLDITGSASEGARINVVGDPFANVPAGRYFNPAAFAEPAVGTIGNAGVNIMYGPGYANWDVTLSRTVPLRAERRVLKFRLEAYNAFNHTQFSGLASGFTFNAGGVNTNNATGTFTSARPPRILSLDLRFQS